MKNYTFKIVHKYMRSPKTKIPITMNQTIKAESLLEANEIIRGQYNIGLFNVYCIGEKELK